MNSVYDVIEVLRRSRNYTLKEVASRASISYTTLASMMSRRPEKIAKNTLAKIGWVFGLEWYKLLGREQEFAPLERENYGRNINGERISAMMDEKMVESVLRNILGEAYEYVLSAVKSGWQYQIEPYDNLMRIRPRNKRAQFMMCVDMVFDKLNDDGIVEAMRHMLELSQNPKFCISTATGNKKEDDECQEEGQ